MSTMASARVPSEIYEQGLAKLSELGSNTTELIVSAFSYVAKTGQLPQSHDVSAKHHNPTAEQLADLRQKLRASCMHIDLPENWDYKQELAEGKWADYEALA